MSVHYSLRSKASVSHISPIVILIVPIVFFPSCVSICCLWHVCLLSRNWNELGCSEAAYTQFHCMGNDCASLQNSSRIKRIISNIASDFPPIAATEQIWRNRFSYLLRFFHDSVWWYTNRLMIHHQISMYFKTFLWNIYPQHYLWTPLYGRWRYRWGVGLSV